MGKSDLQSKVDTLYGEVNFLQYLFDTVSAHPCLAWASCRALLPVPRRLFNRRMYELRESSIKWLQTGVLSAVSDSSYGYREQLLLQGATEQVSVKGLYQKDGEARGRKRSMMEEGPWAPSSCPEAVFHCL